MEKKTDMSGLQRKWWTGIRSRLVLLLLCILIPVLVIQAYIYYDSYQHRREAAYRANLEIARAVSKGVDSFVKDVLHQEMAIGLALTSSRPMTPGDITRILESSRDNKAVRDFTWLNAKGLMVYSSNPAMVGIDDSDRSYFREIAAGREWMVSELVRAKTTGAPVFAIARGVRDRKGALLGIVLAAVIPEKLTHRLAIERYEGGGFAIVDNKGMLVYRYPAIHATWEERNWLRQYPWLGKVIQGEEIVNIRVFANFERKTRLLAATPVSAIGWAVTAATREEDVTRPLLLSIAKSFFLFLFVTLAAFIVAITFSRKIANSAHALHSHALALGRGEMPGQAKVNHVAEFQDLADAFNVMAEKVQARESDLRQSEARFRSVLDNSQDVIYRLNVQTGRYEYISPSAETLSGFTPDEFMAMELETLLAMVHPGDLPALRAAVASLEKTGNVEVEYRQRIKNGDYRWISNRISLAKDDAGRPLYRNGNIRDVTERKRAVMALAERTRQVEDANKELESFTYSVAHDLKVPIRGIEGYARILLKKYGDQISGDATRMLNVIHGNTEKMNNLIDGLLSFSRILRDRIMLAEIDMDILANQVWDDIRAENPGREMEIRIAKLPPGFGDRILIRQVLFNFISNAVKFTGNKKPGIIEVSSYNEPDQVVYCIKDNGAGFDMMYYDKLFGVFHRLHGPEEYEGTGIGLAIARRIIDRHGGRVWAYGEVDKGATFSFTLPLKK